MLPPRVVCFDLGGVLVRICRSFAEACERADLPLRDANWLASAAALQARRQVVLDYQCGALSSVEYFERLREALEGRYDAGELEMLHDAWLIEEYVGAGKLIEALASTSGITAVCLSNTNERHWEALLAPEKPAYPSVLALHQRFASHLMRANKPEPKVFGALQRALDVDASRILFFDDTDVNVEGARLAGWQAELVDPQGDTVAQMRHYLAVRGLSLDSLA
jgi:FMN phosphatase YigB (HAD superfamily)